MTSESTPCGLSRGFVQASALILLLSQSVTASDWPAFRHDVRRSAVSKDTLKFPLKLAWHRKAKLPPRPAFADPVKHPTNIDFAYVRDGAEPVQLDFDHAFHPVSANGRVDFGSSADDSIRCLSLATGDSSGLVDPGFDFTTLPECAAAAAEAYRQAGIADR